MLSIIWCYTYIIIRKFLSIYIYVFPFCPTVSILSVTLKFTYSKHFLKMASILSDKSNKIISTLSHSMQNYKLTSTLNLLE